MRYISDEEVSLSLKLYLWLSPRMETSPQLWNKGREIDFHKLYYYKVGRNIHAIWVDYKDLQEIHFKRIYKKINLLSHEFFIYHNSERTRIGWRIKKVV